MRHYMVSSLIVIALAGCDGSTNNGKNTSDHPASVQGNARRGTSGDAEGAEITVLHVQADGSTTVDENEGATTDADGHYSVNVGLSGESESNLIVNAVYSDGTSARLLLSGAVSEDEDRTAPPMSDETSAEADLFVQLVVSDDMLPNADEASLIRAFIDGSVAASYNDASANETAMVASATEAAITAWISTSDSEGETGAALDAYVSALIDADATADGQSSSSGDASVDAVASLEEAWSASGFSDADLATAMNAAAEAHLHLSEGNDSDAASASVGLMAECRAELMAQAVSDAWGQLEAGGSAGADAASDTLSASVSALADLSVDVMGESWDAASDVYASQIMLDLATSLSVEGALSLTSAVAIAADAQVELSSSVSGASSTDASMAGNTIADGFVSYRATVETDVAAELMASGDFEQGDATAIAEIVAQVYANAE